MVATGLDSARSLRKKEALAIWNAFRDTSFIDNVVPLEYQSDIRHRWNENLWPEAAQQLDGNDEMRVLGYLQSRVSAA